MIKVKFKPDPKWVDFYKGDWTTAILIGGRGSAKTWNAGNFATLETFKNPDFRTLVLRDVSSSINQSILQNIKGRFSLLMQKLEGAFDHVFEIQENQIKNRITGNINILTKGFRQSRVEQQADLKGFEDIDLALIEEAEDLRDEERVNTLIDTLRKEGYKVIIILNTPDLEHWIVKRYFDYENSEYEGFFKLIPKQLKDVCQVIVDYRDNIHLPEQKRVSYANYANPENEKYNLEHYAGKILGLATESQNAMRKFNIQKVLTIETKNPVQVIDGVQIYASPEKGQIYSMGIDPSSGLGADWTAISLRGFYPDKITGKHKIYAQMKAKLGERETARVAINLANWYNKTGKVLLVPEVNGLGRAVVNYIIDGYNNDWIYKRYIVDDTKPDDNLRPDFGWQTNGNTRDKMINNLTYLFADNKLEVLNEEEKKEMATFVYVQSDKDVNKGRYEAQKGSNDDILFSDMMAVSGFDYIRQYL